jgi:hypothetical protein
MGVDRQEVNVVKEYGFRAPSACCHAMLQYFYTGYILGSYLVVHMRTRPFYNLVAVLLQPVLLHTNVGVSIFDCP